MHAPGIETGAGPSAANTRFLQRHFGKAGSWDYDIARRYKTTGCPLTAKRKYRIGDDFL